VKRSGRRRGRRGGELSGRRRLARGSRETAGAGEVTVGATAVRARRALSGRRDEAGAVGWAWVSEAAIGTRDGFKPQHRRGAWWPRGSGAIPRGPGAARGV
jgi:hypothetical protein